MRTFLLMAVCVLNSFAAGISIVAARVQQFEGGPALTASQEFQAGETVFFSFSVSGFSAKDHEVILTSIATALAGGGVPLTEPCKGNLRTTLAPEDAEWKPVLRGSILLPPVLFGGEYRLSLSAHDENSGANAETFIPFSVSGPEPWGQQGLTVRNLTFYWTEEDEHPLVTPAYRTSETIVAKFEVAGFIRQSDKPLDVVWGVTLLDAAGKVVHHEPVAARERSTAFYPRPYISGSIALTLKPGTPPGPFTLVVTVYDGASSNTAETRATFRIE